MTTRRDLISIPRPPSPTAQGEEAQAPFVDPYNSEKSAGGEA
jgi:hypothetical protein